MGSKANGANLQRIGPSVSVQNDVQDETPSSEVTMSLMTRSWEAEEGHSVSALLLICFTWAFPSDHTQGVQPGESLLFRLMTVLLFFCYTFLSLKFMTEIFIYFHLYAFPHLPSPYHVGDLNVSVSLSLTALKNGRETAKSPFTRGSSPWEESAGLGRALRDWQLPSSSSYSVWCPEEMAVQRLAMPALPLPALLELAAAGLHPVLTTKAQWERKIKPLSVAEPASPYSTLKWSLRGLVKVQQHICGRGGSWIQPLSCLDSNLQLQLSVQDT